MAKEPTSAEAIVETAQAEEERVGPPSAAALGIDGQVQPTAPALSTPSREEAEDSSSGNALGHPILLVARRHRCQRLKKSPLTSSLD
ncbi:hypothetical protein E2562_003804 [Oryza meyeriana var. granulata]|uniref:Uncharacterized protein n=1 Tax=Oryza meyeriana var. granulata TaxID=110450 RepID=A0A6G1BRC0_9ORYZ|nr:hypothetical protein E2562_003804 [Oryza meyeriana var. granulata]